MAVIIEEPGRGRRAGAWYEASEVAMNSGMAVLGGVLVVVGGVWTLQGAGYLAGSAMTGVTLWAVVGPVVVLVGIGMIVRAVRKGRSRGE